MPYRPPQRDLAIHGEKNSKRRGVSGSWESFKVGRGRRGKKALRSQHDVHERERSHHGMERVAGTPGGGERRKRGG